MSLIVLFAIHHVEAGSVEITKTQKAGLGLGRAMRLHMGTETQEALRDWARRESASVNAIIITVLHRFFVLMRQNPKLDDELQKTKKAAKKASAQVRKVNRQGHRWTDGRIAMTFRLPPDLELEIRKYTLTKGDMSLIVLFALDHVEPSSVEIIKTRMAGLGLGRPMILHIGTQAREALRNWALRESTSVNAIVVTVLDRFFALTRQKPKLDEELRLELRARSGL